jgi:hypothetical protein
MHEKTIVLITSRVVVRGHHGSQEAEVGGSQDQLQPGLHSKFQASLGTYQDPVSESKKGD